MRSKRKDTPVNAITRGAVIVRAISFTISLFYCILGLGSSYASAAIVHIGSLGSANSVISGTTLVITTGATLEVGNCAVLGITKDNFAASDGNNNEITGVVDSAGNTWTEITEYTYAEGSAGGASTVGIYVTRATVQLTSGGTITATFADAITSKAMRAREFSCGAALQLVGTPQTENVDSTVAGSLAISGLANEEHLYIRLQGQETNATTAITVTSTYTDFLQVGADGGTIATSQRLIGEFLIATSTGSTSAPTTTTSADSAGLFVALRETPTTRPISPIIFQ